MKMQALHRKLDVVLVMCNVHFNMSVMSQSRLGW